MAVDGLRRGPSRAEPVVAANQRMALGPAPDPPDPAGALARHSGVDSVHRLAGVRERLAAAMEPCGAGVGPEAPEEGERDALK